MSHDDQSPPPAPLPTDVQQLQTLLMKEREVCSRHERALAQRDKMLARRDETLARRNETLAQSKEALAQHEAIIAQQHDTIEQQQRKIELQELRLAGLLRRQYGPQRERIDPNQLMLFSAEELAELAEELQNRQAGASKDNDSGIESTRGGKRRKRGHGRRGLPKHLPREQVVYELSATERTCPCCGEQREEIGSESSEQLEVIPAKVKVIEHVRKKYACRQCEEQVTIAPKPPQPIDKGLPGAGLLAHSVLSKYGDHLPLYRQEDILARHGITIRRSTLCGWMAAAAELARPLWELMRGEVLNSHVIHTDDTTVRMLSPGKCRTARFWVYVGDAAHRYSLFDFTESRSRDGPAKFLDGFSGYLQADAYGGYDGLYHATGAQEVACWAHARRYWWEARATDSRRAHEALSYIGRLYELEEQFREAKLSGDPLRAARQQHATPILDALEQWLDDPSQQSLLPKSPIGKARTYTQNQWQALRRYVNDGALSIDNNVAERTVKLAAIGRKNYLFVGSPTGGERAAILYSLIASCKACGVEPWAYLADLFAKLPGLASTPESLTAFLPDRWLAEHPEHRWQIDELRKKERRRTRRAKIAKRRRKKK